MEEMDRRAYNAKIVSRRNGCTGVVMKSNAVPRLLLALLLVAPLALAKDQKHDPEEIGNRGVGKGINFYSLEKEIALGKQMAQEAEREAKLLDDAVVTEYVNRLSQTLVRHSDAKVPFTIK